MAEDPIKLFATRAEQLPQSDDGQTLREAIEKGVEQVPIVGPITTFITHGKDSCWIVTLAA